MNLHHSLACIAKPSKKLSSQALSSRVRFHAATFTSLSPKVFHLFFLARQDFADHFASVGGLRSARLARKRGEQRPQGFGFVEYESAEAAAEALSQLHDSDLKGRTLQVRCGGRPRRRACAYVLRTLQLHVHCMPVIRPP
jgi:hypothetical protein